MGSKPFNLREFLASPEGKKRMSEIEAAMLPRDRGFWWFFHTDEQVHAHVLGLLPSDEIVVCGVASASRGGGIRLEPGSNSDERICAKCIALVKGGGEA